MEHIERTVANHLKPSPYGTQYNLSKFKPNMYPTEYLSNSSRKPICGYCRAYCVSFSSGSNTGITVAKETS